MSNHTDPSAFSARIFFIALAGLGLLAGGIVVYVVATKADADREQVAAQLAEPAGAAAAAVPAVAAEPPAGDATTKADPPKDAVPVAAEPPPVAVADDAPAVAPVEQGAILGDWRLKIVRVVATPFAFTEPDTQSPRVAIPAPLGERHVHVELEVNWRGVDPRRVEVSHSGSLRPSAVFTTESQSFDPAGRLADEPDPFTPIRTDSVVWQPGETRSIVLVFRLPEAVGSGRLTWEGLTGPAIELPAAPAVDPLQLVGRWRRSDRLLQPVRRGEPLFDAMNADASRVLLITRSGGNLNVSLPGAGVSGKGTVGPAGVPLKLGGDTAPVRFQSLGDDAGMLVYIGADGRSALLYEPWPEE